MKKKLILSVFLVAAIFLNIFVGTGFVFVSASESEKAETIVTDYYSNVNKSMELYNKAMRQYASNKIQRDGVEINMYHNDFAGVFIDDDGVLNIGLVEPKDVLDFAGQVIYRQQIFSYNDLQEIKNALVLVMDNFNIFTIGIDEKLNKVSVSLEYETSVDLIVHYLQGKELYRESALDFIFNPNGNIKENANIVHGGDRVRNHGNSSSPSGTFCVNAIDNKTGIIGVLTNEHVVRTPRNLPISCGENFIGNRLIGQRGGTIDAAFVPFVNQNDWSPTSITRLNATSVKYSNIRLGNNGHIIQGMPIRRIGQNTGDTTGFITGTNVTTTLLSDVFTYSNIGQDGDSGGPVYFHDGANTLHLIGMHYASSATDGFACRIANVMNILDVTPITNDGFNLSNLPGNDIQINYLNFNLTGAFDIPVQLFGRTGTRIDDGALGYQTNLTSVSIPSTVRSIGRDVFAGTSLWNNWPLNSVVYVDKWAVGYKGVLFNDIMLQSNTVGIADYAFSYSYALTDITIPFSVINIGGNAFLGCNSLAIYVQAANSSGWAYNWNPSNCSVVWNLNNYSYIAINQAHYYLMRNGEVCLVSYTGGAGALNIPATVTMAGIVRTVTIVGNNAFAWTNITSVTFDANSQLIHVDNSAFTGSMLENIVLPEGLISIGDSAFAYCEYLASAVLPRSLTSIGEYTFAFCYSLTSVTISENVSYIGSCAFEWVLELTIYAEAVEKPIGWNYDWSLLVLMYYPNHPANPKHPVMWGCTLSGDQTYVESLSAISYLENDNSLSVSDPYREGYTFDGWVLINVTYYAIWV